MSIICVREKEGDKKERWSPPYGCPLDRGPLIWSQFFVFSEGSAATYSSCVVLALFLSDHFLFVASFRSPRPGVSARDFLVLAFGFLALGVFGAGDGRAEDDSPLRGLLTASPVRVRLYSLRGVLDAELGTAFGGPFFGEVQAGELAVVQDGRTVVRPSRIDLQVEIAEELFRVCKLAFCAPLAPSLVVVDAFVLGARAVLLAHVALVLLGRADAEIGSAVVALIGVHMVHEHPIRGLHNQAVHEDPFAVLGPGGVSLVAHVPLPPAEPLVVSGVDVGVEAVAQRDHADISCGQGGLAAVVAAGDARNVVHLARPQGVVGTPRQDRLAQPQPSFPQLRIADAIHAIVTAPSGHDFSLPMQLSRRRAGTGACPYGHTTNQRSGPRARSDAVRRFPVSRASRRMTRVQS